jgi:hypothetical protein
VPQNIFWAFPGFVFAPKKNISKKKRENLSFSTWAEPVGSTRTNPRAAVP